MKLMFIHFNHLKKGIHKIKPKSFRLWSITSFMLITKRLFIFTLLLLSAKTNFAQIGGSSTYNFLELPYSARAAALGGTFVGVRDGDLGLAATNPSFLDTSVNNHVVMSYTPLYAGIDYGYVAYARSIKDIGTFDVGIKDINYGTFTQADDIGNITGTFTAAEYMFNVGYGRSLKDSLFSAGINLKGVYSALDQYYSFGGMVDLGVSYVSPNRCFFLGAVIQNVGAQIKEYYPGNSEPVPLDADIGVSYKFKHAPFRFNLMVQHLQKWTLTYADPTDTQTVNPLTHELITPSATSNFLDNLGRHLLGSFEMLLGKNFAVRFAYNYEERKELSLTTRPSLDGMSGGFEMKIYKFHISYALAKYNLNAFSNTFTFIFDTSQFYGR